MAIRNLILDRKAEELPAEIIENYLRYGDTEVGGVLSSTLGAPILSYIRQIK